MNKILELLKKIKITTSQEEGQAKCHISDLLGDHHQYDIQWDTLSLKIEKKILHRDDILLDYHINWSLDPSSNKIKILDKKGFSDDLKTTLDILKFIRKELENGYIEIHNISLNKLKIK